MEHQDWNTIILKKPIQVQSKKSNELSQKTKMIKKLESDEIVIPPKSNMELKLAIQKARIANKLSQKQLAASMNTTTQIINQYESGKAVPNNNFISKLEKKLKIKLPRIKNN